MQIYIPLWFYSNCQLFIRHIPYPVFTFHYGSILISTSATCLAVLSSFTFHYGSILIWTCFLFFFDERIYIPLWFYSNTIKDCRRYFGAVFTFHYGSILIYFHQRFLNIACIFTFHYGSILIDVSSTRLSDVYVFTFHYGSILISPHNPTVLIATRFTFHYGSILIHLLKMIL